MHLACRQWPKVSDARREKKKQLTTVPSRKAVSVFNVKIIDFYCSPRRGAALTDWSPTLCGVGAQVRGGCHFVIINFYEPLSKSCEFVAWDLTSYLNLTICFLTSTLFFILSNRSPTMDRRACDHLAELVDQGVLAGKCQQGAVPEDEWPRHCRARSGGFPGDCATLHRRHPVGASGAAAKR